MSSYKAYERGMGRNEEQDILKKAAMVALLVGFMLLLAVTAALAQDGQVPDLPAQVTAALGEQVKIEDAIEIDNVSGINYIFTITTENGKKHTLTWFAQIKDEWKKLGKSSSVLPYGEGQVFMNRHTDGSGWGWFSDGEIKPYSDTLGFSVHRIDPEHEEYYMQTVEIHYINHEFQVVGWRDRSKSSEHGYVMDGRICYYDPSVGGAVKSVPLYAVFSLKTSFASLPKSYQLAKKEYSDPPRIPKGTLSAQRVKFAPNQVIAVYQGPGENYGQAGGGKAVVSTNDWIQVFGSENGWLMIQYDITSEHMRIGWIPANYLPQKTKADALVWRRQAAVLAVHSALTDDPLFSQSEIVRLPAGTEMLKLAEMGDWAYVECRGDALLRGFVRAEGLVLVEEELK